MTHAEEVARLRDAVVEAANEWHQHPHGTASRLRLHASVDAFRSAEALTCETCDATGGKWITTVCGDGELADFVPCPACHGTGRATSVAGPSGPEKPDKEEADG